MVRRVENCNLRIMDAVSVNPFCWIDITLNHITDVISLLSTENLDYLRIKKCQVTDCDEYRIPVFIDTDIAKVYNYCKEKRTKFGIFPPLCLRHDECAKLTIAVSGLAETVDPVSLYKKFTHGSFCDGLVCIGLIFFFPMNTLD